jgi:hypothetical protein
VVVSRNPEAKKLNFEFPQESTFSASIRRRERGGVTESEGKKVELRISASINLQFQLSPS